MSAIAENPGLLQRRQALARANQIRIAQAEMKKQIRSGEITIDDALARPDVLVSLRLWDLLLLAPGRGPARIRRVLQRSGVPGYLKLRQLTDNQRATLAQAMAAEGWR
jgi:hypothetical protein